ncbi:MAG: tRNA (guanosine(46)-N7)-methyltransferase TrmB [Alphaproteobacteria bacterium]|nr:MAG: tRNA (guanosine(46)-N7)-methyltransferase TrmB [Alphaproteobacteria bacterium]
MAVTGSRKQPSTDRQTPPDRRLYGRQRGHRLRPGQASLVANLLPQLVVPTHRPNLDPLTLFQDAQQVWLEIGFGAGEHMVYQAKAHPHVGLIGCEPYLNGVAKLLARMARERLSNLRVLQGDARDLLDCLAPGTISRAFLLFPDPWPKTRHHKRRFISAETLDQLARALKPGALFRVATDIPDYCRWTLERFCAHNAFEWQADSPKDWRERADDWPETRYEAKALKAGRNCVYLTFKKIEAQAGP